MNILTKFKLYAKEKPMLAGLISVVVLGLPFVALIVLFSFLIENQEIHAVVSGVIFLAYIATYIIINKFFLQK